LKAARSINEKSSKSQLLNQPSAWYNLGDVIKVSVKPVTELHDSAQRMGPNGLTLRQGRFRLEIRRNLFIEIAVRPWPRLPRAVGESPSLKGFKNCVDVALGDTVEQAWWGWVGSWT